MGRYRIIRTDTADAGLRKIILYVAANFGNAVALEKLDNIESGINMFKFCSFYKDSNTCFIVRRLNINSQSDFES